MSLKLDVDDKQAVAALSDEEARNAFVYFRDRGMHEQARVVLQAHPSADPGSPAPPTDPGVVPGVEPEPSVLPEGFEDFTVKQVIEWAGDSEGLQAMALTAELEREEPRKGVLEAFGVEA